MKSGLIFNIRRISCNHDRLPTASTHEDIKPDPDFQWPTSRQKSCETAIMVSPAVIDCPKAGAQVTFNSVCSSASMPKTSWEKIPKDVQEQVFSRLSAHSVARAAVVSKRIDELSKTWNGWSILLGLGSTNNPRKEVGNLLAQPCRLAAFAGRTLTGTALLQGLYPDTLKRLLRAAPPTTSMAASIAEAASEDRKLAAGLVSTLYATSTPTREFLLREIRAPGESSRPTAMQLRGQFGFAANRDDARND